MDECRVPEQHYGKAKDETVLSVAAVNLVFAIAGALMLFMVAVYWHRTRPRTRLQRHPNNDIELAEQGFSRGMIGNNESARTAANNAETDWPLGANPTGAMPNVSSDFEEIDISDPSSSAGVAPIRGKLLPYPPSISSRNSTAHEAEVSPRSSFSGQIPPTPQYVPQASVDVTSGEALRNRPSVSTLNDQGESFANSNYEVSSPSATSDQVPPVPEASNQSTSGETIPTQINDSQSPISKGQERQ